MLENKVETDPTIKKSIQNEDFEVGQLLAEDIAQWEDKTLIDAWNFIMSKNSIHDLDRVWLEVITNELCFRTSEAKISLLEEGLPQ